MVTFTLDMVTFTLDMVTSTLDIVAFTLDIVAFTLDIVAFIPDSHLHTLLSAVADIMFLNNLSNHIATGYKVE